MSAAAAEHPIYTFEGFRLDTRRRELTSASGARITLTTKQYETLLLFVERSGRLIDKRTLLHSLWPDRIVEENNLNQHITALRQRLGERRGSRRFIVNVRGRGYQFAPEVAREDREARRRVEAPPTSDSAAWQVFQQALFLAGTDEPAQWRVAIDRLGHAIDLDGEFASALAVRAQFRLRSITVAWGETAHELDLAESEAQRAFELRPNSSFTRMAAGAVAAARGRWVEAERQFCAAAEFEEEWPIVGAMHAAHVLLSTGHVRRALALAQRSQARGHGMIGIVLVEALAQLLDDNETAARKLADVIRALGGRSHQPHLVQLFASLAQREGRAAEATQLLNTNLSPALRAAGAEQVVTRVTAAIAERRGGMEAIALLDRLVACVAFGDIPYSMRQDIVAWYAELGDLDRAYAFGHALIDHFATERSVGVLWSRLWGRELAAFRDDRRFEPLAARIGLTAHWRQFGPPDR